MDFINSIILTSIYFYQYPNLDKLKPSIEKLAVKTNPNLWNPIESFGNQSKVLETYPKTWKPIQSYGHQSKAMDTNPKLLKPTQIYKTYENLQ